MPKNDNRIAVLDGIRAYAILIIMGFHLWQQSWMQYVIPGNILQPFGIQNFSLVWIPRTGYMLVDTLLLLSAFCLFLPYALKMADPLFREPDGIGLFYKKRAARIIPPYYLCLLFYVIFLIRPTDYATAGGYWKDLLAHITFTQTFWPDTYHSTHFSTALWTLGIEVQFYLLFPFIAKLFKRYPLQMWAAMNILAELYIALFAREADGGADNFRINQFPAFLGVFANGMLGAVICCRLRAKLRDNSRKQIPLLATLLAFAFGIALACMLKYGLSNAAVVQRWQIDFRFLFSVLSVCFILALDHAHKDLQWFFSCKAIRFIAAISYNLYIWHTTVMLQLKEHHIPYYPEAPADAYAWPQSASGEGWYHTWQNQYVLMFWVLTMILAAVLTYGFEEPLRRLLMKIGQRKQQKQI